MLFEDKQTNTTENITSFAKEISNKKEILKENSRFTFEQNFIYL